MKPALHKMVEVNFPLQLVSPSLAQTELSTGYRRVCMCAYEEFFLSSLALIHVYRCFVSILKGEKLHIRFASLFCPYTCMYTTYFVVNVVGFVPFSIQDKHDATCVTATVVKKDNYFRILRPTCIFNCLKPNVVLTLLLMRHKY